MIEKHGRKFASRAELRRYEDHTKAPETVDCTACKVHDAAFREMWGTHALYHCDHCGAWKSIETRDREQCTECGNLVRERSLPEEHRTTCFHYTAFQEGDQ